MRTWMTALLPLLAPVAAAKGPGGADVAPGTEGLIVVVAIVLAILVYARPRR